MPANHPRTESNSTQSNSTESNATGSNTEPSVPEGHAQSEVDVPAGPARVWERLTTDHGLAHWMGEGAHIEPSVGAPISVPDVVTGQPKQGFVKYLEKDRRLDFVWWPVEDPDDFSEVSITLEPLQTGTRIRVVERNPRCMASMDCVATAEWVWRSAMAALSFTSVPA